jgi:hypothetical protein
MAAVSAQAGCQMLSTSFRKDSTSASGSAGDLLESSSQAFPGSPRSVARLRRQGGSPRSVPATSASLFSMTPGNFMANVIPRGFMANVQEDDVKKDLDEDENVVESSNELLDSINNVLADVVDGQKFLKETGRTKPRPMKRRFGGVPGNGRHPALPQRSRRPRGVPATNRVDELRQDPPPRFPALRWRLQSHRVHRGGVQEIRSPTTTGC